MWVIFAVLGLGGCKPSAEESDHDSDVMDDTDSDVVDDTDGDEAVPRPSCEYVISKGRTPWAMPTLLTDDFSEPVKLAINTDCPEDAIEVSRDGQTLYFLWSPEVNAPADELLNGTTGTYAAAKTGNGLGDFTDPVFFDLGKGAANGSYDGELSFSPDGTTVYFHSTRVENTGYQQDPAVDDPMDIYVADVVDGVPSVGQNLGSPVNTVYREGEHCLSPDGTRLYISSTRPGGVGGVDLWVSDWDGSAWSDPVNLGEPINSTGSDLQPAFAAGDPDTMYFVSDRAGAGSIYRSHYEDTAWTEPEPLITGYVGEPSLPQDGGVLYFVHVSVDDAGVFGADIWYAETAAEK